jgi:hypothetical protein
MATQKRCATAYLVFLVPIVVLACWAVRDATQGDAGDSMTVKLKEVPVFDLPEDVARDFLSGQRAVCDSEPNERVGMYPSFESGQPLYGAAAFSAPGDLAASSRRHQFAIDESEGTGHGYDCLYFDLDRDLDLTNDGVLKVRKDPPKAAIVDYSWVKQQACFESVNLPLPFGSQGERPLEVMPRLLVSESGYKTLSFITTRARQGRVKIAGRNYDVVLGHKYIVAGWFDHAWTGLNLAPVESRHYHVWWGGDRLNATHQIGGTFYRFSATPAGDRLTVRPYEGPVGTFEVGAGDRAIDKMEARGSFESESGGVAVGEPSDDGWPEPARRCRLPVGDYRPNLMTITYGTLRIGMSHNYHSDGKPRDAANRRPVYGITIRVDKPFVFDFSHEPAVMFASPPKNHRLKCGEELKVMAVLTDPVLDIMIRDLDDTTRKPEKELGSGDGTEHTYTRDLSLDPKVTIARLDGEIITEGVMHFG